MGKPFGHQRAKQHVNGTTNSTQHCCVEHVELNRYVFWASAMQNEHRSYIQTHTGMRKIFMSHTLSCNFLSY